MTEAAACTASSLLDQVLITPELQRRPSRPPDYETQARALDSLAAALSDSPHDALQILTDVVVELCNAGSSGVSLAAPLDEDPAFHWMAVSGAWADKRGGTMPIDASPCAVVVEKGSALLFEKPHRYFDANKGLEPEVAEVLLVPLHQQGKIVGTLWTVAHDETRKFDREDVRLLLSLGRMAATILQTAASLEELEEKDRRLRVLVDELQHRTRNLFAVVRSVANLTVRSSRSLAEFGSEFDNRINSLARAQDLVSRADQSRPVTFEELLRLELDGLGAFDGGSRHVHLSGPKNVPLPNEAIRTLAMALHELGTNALKHGALKRPEGRLSVEWRLDQASGVLDIDWKESGLDLGAGEIGEMRVGGGRTLIEEALPAQLGAETELVLEPSGARCSIRLPLR